MSNGKIRLTIRHILYFNGQVVYSTTRQIKARIIADAQVKLWNKGYLKVTYLLGKDYYNDCYFEDLSRLKRMLSGFTEAELVREMS